MPELSFEFWIATSIALFLFVVGLGVTLAMDAKTRGEFRVAAGCFLLSAASTVYVIGVFEMSATWPARLRVPIAWVLFATVAVLACEGVRWAHARHLRAIAVHEPPKSSPSPNPQPPSNPSSALPIKTQSGSQRPLKQRTLLLANKLQTFYDQRTKAYIDQGIKAYPNMASDMQQRDAFDRATISQFNTTFTKDIKTITAELQGKGLDVGNFLRDFNGISSDLEPDFTKRIGPATIGLSISRQLRELAGQIDDEGNLVR